MLRRREKRAAGARAALLAWAVKEDSCYRTDLEEALGWVGEKLVKSPAGTSPVVQWLRLHASTAGGTSSIPIQGTQMPHIA